MRAKFLLFLILFFVCNNAFAENTVIENNNSKLSNIHKYTKAAKLYVPHFVVVGQNADFRVYATPNTKVLFKVDYDTKPTENYEKNTNGKGIAVFTVKIVDDASLVGKSVAVDAYVYANGKYSKAVIQSENNDQAASNRVCITDKEAAKGFMLSPMQALNNIMMYTDYSDESGVNPYSEQMYYDNTPVYIKNMRDAQDNVR